MRLAGTAAPLPRKSGRLESNQRSPVPETGGVANLPHGQLSIESTTVESNHARPPYQSGAGPAARRRFLLAKRESAERIPPCEHATVGEAGLEPAPARLRNDALPLSYSPRTDLPLGEPPGSPRPLHRSGFAGRDLVRSPGQGIEPRSPRSERGVLPVGRSRNHLGLSIHVPGRGVDAAGGPPCTRPRCLARPKPTMLSKPLAYPSTLDHRPPDALSGLDDVLRGGALEPESRARVRKCTGKSYS